MEQALALRGDPHRQLSCVLVAGTNGKGSVASIMASVLKHSGLRVGLYTSPHLHRLTERFRIDGRPMPTRELARRSPHERFSRARHPRMTFFEVAAARLQ